jgi:hypothetical protein
LIFLVLQNTTYPSCYLACCYDNLARTIEMAFVAAY